MRNKHFCKSFYFIAGKRSPGTLFISRALIPFIHTRFDYNLQAEVPNIILEIIHYCMPNMIENNILMIFYDLLMSDVVKCA